MKSLIVMVVASFLTAPATASVRDAAFASSSDRSQAQAAMFGGATYRVGFDQRTNRTQDKLSLKLSGMMRAPGSSTVQFGQGLEIAAGRTGKPALYISGRDVGEMHRTANLSGRSTALIVVGVLVAAVVAAVVVADEIRDAGRCIGEEGDCD